MGAGNWNGVLYTSSMWSQLLIHHNRHVFFSEQANLEVNVSIHVNWYVGVNNRASSTRSVIEDSVNNDSYITSTDVEANNSIRLLSEDVRLPSKCMIFPAKVIKQIFNDHFSMASI